MTFRYLLLAASTLLMATSAQATLFTVKWAGAYGSQASAIGKFNINTAFDGTGSLPSPNFSVVKMTVSGAANGNGTFYNSNFDGFAFDQTSGLDFTKELIGQSPEGTMFGPGGRGNMGNFNLGSSSGAPSGVGAFALGVGTGDMLQVTSILAVAGVPEPASWALMIGGFGLIGATARRRRVAAVSA